MRTYKPISTISYNTLPFLECVLTALFQQGVISEYMYIEHKGEGGEKDHVHVYVNPSSQVDTSTSTFTTMFDEIDPNNPKPLGVMPWRKSDPQNWLLYAVHDKAFLEAKGEVKQYYDYPLEEVKAHDLVFPTEVMASIDKFKFLTPIERMIYCINENMTVYQAMKKCKISYGAMGTFMAMYRQIKQDHKPKYDQVIEFNPDTCEKHTYYIDTQTGEEITQSEYIYRNKRNYIVI